MLLLHNSGTLQGSAEHQFSMPVKVVGQFWCSQLLYRTLGHSMNPTGIAVVPADTYRKLCWKTHFSRRLCFSLVVIRSIAYSSLAEPGIGNSCEVRCQTSALCLCMLLALIRPARSARRGHEGPRLEAGPCGTAGFLDAPKIVLMIHSASTRAEVSGPCLRLAAKACCMLDH